VCETASNEGKLELHDIGRVSSHETKTSKGKTYRLEERERKSKAKKIPIMFIILSPVGFGEAEDAGTAE
jgi:hypothetical protein